MRIRQDRVLGLDDKNTVRALKVNLGIGPEEPLDTVLIQDIEHYAELLGQTTLPPPKLPLRRPIGFSAVTLFVMIAHPGSWLDHGLRIVIRLLL
jgi:hypothetical protein